MRRILVAEDDLALRTLYRVWLERDGYDVTDVADGRAALDELESGPLPDAALLDVDMPRVDGLSVCRYLTARAPGIPVVIATGVDGIETEAFAAGAAAVVAKPCGHEDVVRTLARVSAPRLRAAS